MKNRLILIALLLPVFITGCEKTESSDVNVDEYVDMLEQGTYEAMDLPEFTPEDIPALLEYRNSTDTIEDFPHNMISSLWMDKCRLGVYVLWTVESIRAVETDSESLIGRFPSQNPLIGFRDQDSLALLDPVKAHEDVAQAYYDWWNSDMSLADKLNTDPLADTDYKWY